MSAYIKINMPITDTECLLKALSELGFDEEIIEVHENPVKLVGYEGSLRNETANIVVRKKHVGTASNDIGFKKTNLGYKFIVSDYDRRKYGSNWQRSLSSKYEKHYESKMLRIKEEERKRIAEEKRRLREEQRDTIVEKAKKKGYAVTEKHEGNTIRLALVKRKY